jgi:RimJ/RimL family protein N-acetyltransferase
VEENSTARHRNFDNRPNATELVDNIVRVVTASYANTEKMITLRHKNQKFLAPWSARPKNSSQENYVFEIYAQDILVGSIALWGFSRSEEDYEPDMCSISYWVDEENNKKGIATSAVNLVTKYAFTELGIQLVEAPIQPHNLASIKVVSKLGFRKTKTIVDYLVVNDKPTNHEIYELRP